MYLPKFPDEPVIKTVTHVNIFLYKKKFISDDKKLTEIITINLFSKLYKLRLK